MSDYTEYFLASNSNIVLLELIEITHSNFDATYRIVRNSIDTVTVTLEDSTTGVFVYYPLRITPSSDQNDLDQIFKFEFGDLGEILATQLDNVYADDNFVEKPVLVYRAYKSNDLTTPLYGPINLEISSISFNKTGAVFEAKAPLLNINKTGMIYSITSFPMLRGAL